MKRQKNSKSKESYQKAEVFRLPQKSYYKLILFGLGLVLAVHLSAAGLNYLMHPIREPYEFSTLPGTLEWSAMNSYPEKMDACHVPEEIVQEMSTKALIETMLTHPLRNLTMLTMNPYYDDWEVPFQHLMSRGKISSLLEEILSRRDGPKSLMNAYLKEPVPTSRRMLEKQLILEGSDDSENLSILEIVLGHPDVYRRLSFSDHFRLNRAVQEKDRKKDDSELYQHCWKAERTYFYHYQMRKEIAEDRHFWEKA